LLAIYPIEELSSTEWFFPLGFSKRLQIGDCWPISGLYFNFTTSDMNWNFRINMWIFNGKLF